MQFDLNFMPWLVIPNNDARPSLHYAKLERVPEGVQDKTLGMYPAILSVTDGIMFAKLPAWMQENEVDGLIPTHLLKAAAKAMPRHSYHANLILNGPDRIHILGTQYRRYEHYAKRLAVEDDPKKIIFPDLGPFIPTWSRRLGVPSMQFCINPKQLLTMCQVLNIKWPRLSRIGYWDVEKQKWIDTLLLVETDDPKDKLPTIPYGAIAGYVTDWQLLYQEAPDGQSTET